MNDEELQIPLLYPSETRELRRRLYQEFPSAWATAHRPELSFDGSRLLLKEILDSTLEGRTVIEGGAQWGKTDSVSFTRALHHLDTFRTDLLYLFPTQAIASEFSAGRFNPLLDRNPYLRSLFTDVDNVHHKRAGQANFYVRGSNSEAQLISIPVQGLIVDEFDRMNLNNLGLARDRMMGQKETFEVDISTPTHPGMGIDHEYSNSDRRRFLVECPNCKERRPMSMNSIGFLESNPDDATWQCPCCSMPWSDNEKNELVSRGTWVAERPGAGVKGFQVPTLISPIKPAAYYARRWVESQTSESQLQIFHNSVLGQAYAAEGMQVTEEMLLRAMQGEEPYRSLGNASHTCMGVDVGAVQHYVIAQKQKDGQAKVVRIGTARSIDDLDELITRYDVKSLVIDANPERQKARDLMLRINRKRFMCVFMAFYPEMKEPIRWDKATGRVDLNRTEILDTVVGRFKNDRIRLPLDCPEEFRLHLRSIVRVNEIDKRTGNAVGRWRESGSIPDHFAHALAYCEAASQRLAIGAAQLGIFVV